MRRSLPRPRRAFSSPKLALLVCVLLRTHSAPGDAAQDESSSGASGRGVTIERLDAGLDALLDPDAPVDVVVRDRLWVEGPVFCKGEGALLFSDVRDNAIYSWKTTDAKSGPEETAAAAATAATPAAAASGSAAAELVRPSGWLSSEPPRMWEPGSNGLALDAFGNLVVAQHGERQIARVPLSELFFGKERGKATTTAANFRPVASRFQGKRFNSPNDLAFNPLNGDLFFTDPVYGLEKYGEDPLRELPFQGVFRIPAAAFEKAVAVAAGSERGESSADSAVTLEVSSLSSPNGLAFSRDGKTLFVSNSGKEASFWASFEIDPVTGRVLKRSKKNEDINNGTCSSSSSPSCSSSSFSPPSLEEDGGKKLWDVTDELKSAREAGKAVGASDGFKLDVRGNAFASAIDSVLIFSPRFRKLLGKIVVGDKIGNVAFGGEDGSELFIAANSRMLRVRTKTEGSFFPATKKRRFFER